MNANTYWTTIPTPGKFEGEPVLCRYLWKKTLDGGFETFDFGSESFVDHYTIIEPTEAESIRWGLEPKTQYLAIHESNQGFVSLSEWSKFDYERFQDELAEQIGAEVEP